MAGSTARRQLNRVSGIGLGLIAVRAMLPRRVAPWPDMEWLVGITLLLLLAAWSVRGSLIGKHQGSAAYVLAAALAVLLWTLHSHPFRLTSDGVDHYVYLRSLWMDGDLDLANDYERISPRGRSVDPLTPTGRTGNLHPIGPAIVWAPFYILADGLSRIVGLAPDGENRLYQNAVSVASVFYGWLGLVFIYLTARSRAGSGPALLAALGVGFGSFIFWYLAYAPTMAHAPAFAAAALVVWLWWRPGERTVRDHLVIGAACGLAALLRWPNGLIILLPLVESVGRLRDPERRSRLPLEWAALGGGALLVFLPQMIVWKLLYGSFITIPQGSSFVAGNAAIDGVLFSPRHGLFSWSPLLYLGVIGWLWLGARAPWRGIAALAFAVALVRVNAGVADWWGGSAFGARRFDALVPLLGLGLAVSLSQLGDLARRRPLILPSAVLAMAVSWNLLLAAQYLRGEWDYGGPVSFEQMGHAAVSRVDRAIGSPFSLPGSLAEWWSSGRRLSDYESLYMDRPYSRWSIRMGLDERMFLDDGWTAPFLSENLTARSLAGRSAGLVVPLHRAWRYALGARLRADGEGLTRVQALANGRRVGAWDVGAEWADYEMEVPEAELRPGRNLIRLRTAGDRAGGVAVAAVWMEPIR